MTYNVFGGTLNFTQPQLTQPTLSDTDHAKTRIDKTTVKPAPAAPDVAQNKVDTLASHGVFWRFAIEAAGTRLDMVIRLTQKVGRPIATITENIREVTYLRTLKVRLSKYSINIIHVVKFKEM